MREDILCTILTPKRSTSVLIVLVSEVSIKFLPVSNLVEVGLNSLINPVPDSCPFWTFESRE